MKSQSGFGLIQVLIAMAVLGGMSIGIVKLMEDGQKSSMDKAEQQEIRDLRDEFYVALDSERCGLLGENETFENKKIKLNVEDSKGKPLDNLYGHPNKDITPIFTKRQKFGNMTIHPTDAFRLGPISRGSPLIKTLENKTDGGYYELAPGMFAAELHINILKRSAVRRDEMGNVIGGTRPVTLKFLTHVELNSNSEIVGCKLISDLGASFQNCDNIKAGDNIDKTKDLHTLECTLSYAGEGEDGANTYEMDEVGNVDPSLYVLSEITEN